ncbi:MAG: magnesium transporter [Holosporales bacterium]
MSDELQRTDAPNPSLEQEEQPLFGVSSERLQQITEALENSHFDRVEELIAHLKAPDLANLIQELDASLRRVFLRHFKDALTPETLIELDEEILQEAYDVIGTEGIAAAVQELESDEAFELIEDLEDEQQQEVLRAIPAIERAIIEESFSYPEDSAGRLMQRETVCVPPFWTVEEALNFVRTAEGMPNHFYTVYVVDPRHHPMGWIDLATLIRKPLDQRIGDIMEKELILIQVTQDQEEVSKVFRHYNLMSAPVVDGSGRMLGTILMDNVVSVIEEEAEEDIFHIARLRDSDLYASITSTSYWRIRWLIVTLINTLMASFVISRFESSIQSITALSFLMTINAAMGGNAGMQALTVVIRALATRDIRQTDFWRVIRKELSVSLLTGSFFALMLGTVAGFWVGNPKIGMILGASVLFNIIWAAFAGSALPLIIERLNLDPAVSAGPILTSTTDIVGYSIFLGLATLILL